MLRSLEKIQPVIPDKEVTQDSNAFELEFIRVAVKRGLARETLNELVSVLNKYNKGNTTEEQFLKKFKENTEVSSDDEVNTESSSK